MNQNKQSIEKAILNTIIKFTYISFFIGLIIGLIFSYIPKNPIVTILLGIVGALIQFKFEPLDKLIKGEKEKIMSIHKNLLNEIKEKREEHLNESKNIPGLNYLAIVNDMTGIENINEYDKFQKDMTINEFKDSLKKRSEYFEASNKAIAGLLSHVNSKNGNQEKVNYINVIAKNATIKVVEDHQKQDEIYELLIQYLNAWLICSIKYQTNDLPINWINPKKENIGTTIEALKFIKEDITQNAVLEKQMDIPKQSIKIIEEYLETLIDDLSKTSISSKV